jgi:adenosine deaminase
MSPTSYRTAPPRGDRLTYDDPGFAPAGAESGRMGPSALAKRIPKIHLHCHLEGTLRPATFVELAAKHGVGLRYRPVLRSFDKLRAGQDDAGSVRDDGDPYRFEGIQEFLYLFAAVSRSLQEPSDYARLAAEFVEDALAQGVIYGELFVSPPVWAFFNPSLDVRSTMEAIVSELRRARPRAIFRLLPDLTRNFGEARAMETARAMATMTDLDVIGVSLGGDEVRFPAGLFVEPFAYARSQGLHCVAHAGEVGGAASVRDAVELLGAERIGHGIRALDDPKTVEVLASRGIPLEICPTSNRLTGAVLTDHPHPYVDFDRLGCIVTIDSDDPALFHTSIAREYELVERTAGPGALESYVRNAIEATFAQPIEKQAMRAQLDRTVAELHERSSS